MVVSDGLISLCEYLSERLPWGHMCSSTVMACLTLANLSDVPDIQARWLMMSRTWFELAQKADEPASQSDSSNVVPLKSR